jgi:outer membrane protein TolC
MRAMNFLCVTALTGVIQAAPLTLSQALTEGLSTGPEAQVLKNSTDSANEKVRSVKSVAYPHVSAYANAGLGQSPNASAALMKALAPMLHMPAPSDDPYYSYAWGVQATQPLFTFGKISTALRMASTQERITKASTLATRQSIQQQVVDAWFNAVLANARLDLLQKSIERQGETVKTLERNFALGSGMKAQILMARSKLIASRQDLIAAQSASQAARKALNRLVARPSEDTTALDTNGLAQFESMAVPDREQLVRNAYDNRQDLKSLNEARTLMEDYYFINKAAYYPTIGLQGKFGFVSATQNASGIKNAADWDNRDWSIGVGMQWTLFDGWDNAGQAGQTQAAVRTLAVRTADMNRGIDISASMYLRDKEAADTGLASAKEGVAAAREAWELYRANFASGQGQLTDILSAEENLRAAELGLFSARLARTKACIHLTLVQGKDLISLSEAQ